MRAWLQRSAGTTAGGRCRRGVHPLKRRYCKLSSFSVHVSSRGSLRLDARAAVLPPSAIHTQNRSNLVSLGLLEAFQNSAAHRSAHQTAHLQTAHLQTAHLGHPPAWVLDSLFQAVAAVFLIMSTIEWMSPSFDSTFNIWMFFLGSILCESCAANSLCANHALP